jgi:hypothetical protein
MVGCVRCGFEFLNEESAEKYIIEKRSIICTDCKRPPVKTIRYLINGSYELCRPWHGEYDSEDYPIDKYGKRFTGTEALCGHRDCINAAHRPEMQSSRINRGSTYRMSRTKKLLSPELLVAVAEARGQL